MEMSHDRELVHLARQLGIGREIECSAVLP